MIQEFHKGVEIELEIHQLVQGLWKCDYTLIMHPERTKTNCLKLLCSAAQPH
jgi:hypothetical protein